MRIPENVKIYLLFFLSGISGLIYETVWLRVLIRILGSTVYATSIILAAFMAGLAVGSFLLGRWSSRSKNLLRLYAYLELGVGLSAVILMAMFSRLIPLYQAVFTLTGGNRMGLTLFQSALMFIILLVPTGLMGGTLPVLSAYTKKFPHALASRVGALYGMNTLGAVIGVLGSGIVFIGWLGELRTVLIGAVINLAVSFMALELARRPGPGSVAMESEYRKQPSIGIPTGSALKRIVLIGYATSGFVAISYEVVWTRMFQISLGTSMYSFSMMLACYLLGIALGSLTAVRLLNRPIAPLVLFAAAQATVSFLSIAGMHLFPLFPSVNNLDYVRFSGLFLMPLIMVTPLTFVLGLIFPVVSHLYVADSDHAGKGVGILYSANTLGCIAGSLVTGFVFIGLLGTRSTMVLLSWINLLIAIALISRWCGLPGRWRLTGLISAISIITVALGLIVPDPFLSGVRSLIHARWKLDIKHLKSFRNYESISATTTAFQVDDMPQSKQLWINGVGMTILCTEAKIMAHLPLMMHPAPKNMLVICFGMGTALRSAWIHRDLRCDAVEIVPEVYNCFAFFHADGARILADPRIHYFGDDGRNFMLMRPEKYDVITMDPAPPLFSAGTVNLYTVEFFKLCRNRLRSGGIMCLWIPPDRFPEIRMIMKSFYAVFPDCLVWGGPIYPGMYLTGFNGPIQFDQQRFFQADQDTAIVADLNEWNNRIPKPSAMLGLLILSQKQLSAFLQGARIVTDDVPYTEFPLWRAQFDPTYQWRLNALSLTQWRDRTFKTNADSMAGQQVP